MVIEAPITYIQPWKTLFLVFQKIMGKFGSPIHNRTAIECSWSRYFLSNFDENAQRIAGHRICAMYVLPMRVRRAACDYPGRRVVGENGASP